MWWPEDAPAAASTCTSDAGAGSAAGDGYIVGWNVSGLVCCAAMIVPDTSTTENGLKLALGLYTALCCGSNCRRSPALPLCHAAESLAADHTWSAMWAYCGGPPLVLGTWSASRSDSGTSPAEPSSATHGALDSPGRNALDSVSARVRLDTYAAAQGVTTSCTACPCVGAVRVGGLPCAAPVQVVLYTPPDASRFHYMSTVPLGLWQQRQYVPAPTPLLAHGSCWRWRYA